MKKKLPKNSGRGGIYVKYFVYWQALFITSKSEPFGGIIPDRLRSASGLKSRSDLRVLSKWRLFQILRSMADILVRARAYISDVIGRQQHVHLPSVEGFLPPKL